MRELISNKLNTKLDEIVTKLFEGNRICDRGMSILNVKFAMNKTEGQLHPKLAHAFPALADKVSEYQASRDNLTVYGATPLDASDYVTPLAFFEKVLDYMMDLESLIGQSVEMAKEEDWSTFTFLSGFLKDIAKVTAQCLLLVDKAEMYGDDWKLFDHNIEDFVTL